MQVTDRGTDQISQQSPIMLRSMLLCWPLVILLVAVKAFVMIFDLYRNQEEIALASDSPASFRNDDLKMEHASVGNVQTKCNGSPITTSPFHQMTPFKTSQHL